MSATIERLFIPSVILNQLFDHARREAPRECCGLLGGRIDRVDSIHPLRNAKTDDAAETRYLAEPTDLITAVRSIREGGSEILAIYHSHPRWSAIPSKTDIRDNFWGDTPRPIVSLLTQPPTMRVWRLSRDSFVEIPWEISDDPGLSSD